MFTSHGCRLLITVLIIMSLIFSGGCAKRESMRVSSGKSGHAYIPDGSGSPFNNAPAQQYPPPITTPTNNATASGGLYGDRIIDPALNSAPKPTGKQPREMESIQDVKALKEITARDTAGQSVSIAERQAAGLTPEEQNKPVTDPNPTLARDLGEGAGGEKLGNPFLPDREERPLPEQLPALRENQFTRTSVAGGDASTFAADVDSASYNVVRSCLLDQHRVPHPSEVRIEELINRFSYQYPTPTANDPHPFLITNEVVACPWRRDHQIVRIGIAGETLGRRQRPPANLVFLIDVSGSMSPENRLPLLKSSLSLLVDQLDENDRVAIIAYAGRAGIALDATPGNEHRTIKRAINSLGSSGSTHGAEGIREAYRLARLMQAPRSETRVILATDGDFNVGITDGDDLVRLIRREAEAGIYLNALGFGMGGGGDARLQQLADQGNGFHAFIDRPDEAKRLFITQLPGSLVTIAQDVKIQVFFNPASVSAWRLIGYENRQLNREDFNNDRIDAGEIGAGHTMTALYEIIPAGMQPPANDPNPFTANEQVQHAAPAPFPGDTLMRVRVRYQPPGGGTSRLIEQDVRGRDWRRSPSQDTNFAMGLAGFGMLLRNSQAAGSCTWELVSELIQAGGDTNERQEMHELIKSARRFDR